MAKIKEAQTDAPNYAKAADTSATCIGCQFADGYNNYCRLYDFTFQPWFTCSSFKARAIQRPYYEAQITPRLSESEKAGEKEFEGKEWEVTIIGPKTNDDLITADGQQYIKSLNGRLYSVKAIEASASDWDGIKVYDNHLTNAEFAAKQGMRSPVQEWLGTIVSPFFDKTAKALKGTFKVVEDNLAKKLKNAWDSGVLNSVGLSIDTFIKEGKSVVFEGKTWPTVEGFEKILSVDLVGDPAAGGGFNRILAAMTAQEAITEMTPEELEEKINTAVTAAIGKLDIAATVKTTMAEALAADAETPEETPATDPPAQPDPAVAQATQEARLARCELMLERKITAAKLTGPFETTIREAFTGKVFEEKELDGMIKNLKEAQAATDPSGRVSETGQQRGDMQVFSEADKQAMMFVRKVMQTSPHSLDKLVQNQENELVKPRVFEAYNSWVHAGKPNLNYNGRLSELIRVGFLNGEWSFDDVHYKEALTLATVIKNTVNIMVALDYMGQNLWYEQIVDIIESDNPIDDVTLARLFGAEALDVVAKGAPYTEMTLQDEEETASHVKQGNYVAVALEDLLADKINYFVSLPSRISDAWALTLSAKVAGVFTVNTAAGPVLSDTGALFNATAVTSAGGHANLLTTALAWSSYDAVITAMLNQTSRPLGAGRKLTNMGPFYLLHPNNLRSTASFIRNTDNVPGTANLQKNPYGPDSGQQPTLVNVPDWTDTNDWAVVARYNGMSPIKLVFPRGKRTPEIFIADSELAGSMFTDDTIRYKLRMLTYDYSSTYRVAPVVDWRLLHKSNI